MNFPSILSIIGFVLVTLGGQSLVNGNFIRDLASVAYNELIGDINVITSYVPNIASALSQVCFPVVGCFDQYVVFNRLTKQLQFFTPQSPQEMNLSYTLLRHDEPFVEYRLSFDFDDQQLIDAGYRPDRRTVILLHGWLNSYESSRWWMYGAYNSTLSQAPDQYQIIALDWGQGAKHSIFLTSVANVKVVAASLAALVRKLVDQFGAEPSDIHVIGFSLGAHIAGFAGKNLTNKYRLGAITGLDPAAPMFDGNSASERLDRFDASFVKIIHTYSGGLLSGYSIADPIGIIDLYINGGSKQPGCSDPPFGAVTGLFSFSCNHHRAPQMELFDFSDQQNWPQLQLCQPVAYKCASYEQFMNGRCSSCGVDGSGCVLMGFWPNQRIEKETRFTFPSKFFVNTLAHKPYCAYHYQILIHIGGRLSNQRVSGTLLVHLPTSRKLEITSEYERSSIHSKLVVTDQPLTLMERLKLNWISNTGLFGFLYFPQHTHIKQITFNYLSHLDEKVRQNQTVRFCPQTTGTLIQHEQQIKKDMLVISFDEEEEFDYEFQISNSNRK